jgi:hypothetical protein
MSARRDLTTMVRWYAANVYGRLEGPGTTPFYADRSRVGAFAVEPTALARGTEAALHQVVVSLAMYQSRRDVDIMAIQKGMPRAEAVRLTSPYRLKLAVEASRCIRLADAAAFDACDVRRDLAAGRATCDHRPRTPCHVKDASLAIGRMGDMGMLPTSTWLHLRQLGGFRGLLERACAGGATPAAAADRMVVALAEVHRIGEKLATMIVAQLATPALAPGLTPWAPRLDGNHLVVVDANVMRVIDVLRPRGARTYAAYATWLRARAAAIDLRDIRADWPRTSPRLVQQAVYWFRSRANREAAGLGCAGAPAPCAGCVPRACAFVIAR